MNGTPSIRTEFWLWGGCAALFALLFYSLLPMLTPFIVGAVLAYICGPITDRLSALGLPRSLAAWLTIMAVGLVLVTLVLLVLPIFWRQIAVFIQQLPDLLGRLDTLLQDLGRRIGVDIDRIDPEFVRDWLKEHWASAQSWLLVLLGKLKSGGAVLVGTLIDLALIPLVMFYLLVESPRLRRALLRLLPRDCQQPVARKMRGIDQVLAEFLRGQLSVMIALAFYYSISLSLAGLNFALPIGVITGLVAFIPYVGYGTGVVLATLATLLQGPELGLVLPVVIIFALGQALETYVLTPYLVGERIGLHPLAVIFVLMAFAHWFGFVGMLIALPTGAVLLVVLRDLLAAWKRSTLYRGRRGKGP